jgi:hypothetical protein
MDDKKGAVQCSFLNIFQKIFRVEDDDVCNSIQLFSDNISISKVNTQLYSHSPIQEIMLQERVKIERQELN